MYVMKAFHKVIKSIYGYQIDGKWFNKIVVEYRGENGEKEEREYIAASTVSRVKMMQDVKLFV
jgi:hypothetical protein